MRTHYCGQLDLTHVGIETVICGWVHRRRDHGGIIFLDVRDRTGLVQVVIDPDFATVFKIAENLRNEYTIKVSGKLAKRPEGTENDQISTSDIEIIATDLEILNSCHPLPFSMDGETVTEEVRLKYRYLDLRRPQIAQHIVSRHKFTSYVRNYLDKHEFIDIETPLLTRSTPEGARDFVVPSRNYHGEFYSLPQSPQLFKQLLMVSGFERYYQIAKCFRDEDLRADRQPEFTQIDIEMSFVTPQDIMKLTEDMVSLVFKEVSNIDLPNPFPSLTWSEAMNLYGTDQPDLRNPLKLTDFTEDFQNEEFAVFREPAQSPHGRVAGLKVPDGNRITRKEINQLTEFVATYGAKGLAYIKIIEPEKGREGLQSPILKFLSETSIERILQKTKGVAGDMIFFGAGQSNVVNQSLSELRKKIGEDLELIDQTLWSPVWIVDFPLFNFEHEEKIWTANHHPFTAPDAKHEKNLKDAKNIKEISSQAYDLVLNGSEIGGGSIRINDPELQLAALEILGITQEYAWEAFGFLLKALGYGAPPHGGIALGVDRIVAMMNGTSTIRDVIAFPKTQKGQCLVTSAPSTLSTRQLNELNLKSSKKTP